MQLTAEEIQKNIAALKNKVGDARTGGKGSQRRKVKVISKPSVGDDKVVKSVVKKLGVQPIPGVDEVNFFRDDNTVLHFNRPEFYISLQSSALVVNGNPETKTIKDLLPGVINQLGPKQLSTLQDLIKNVGGPEGEKVEEVPDLVPSNLDQPE